MYMSEYNKPVGYWLKHLDRLIEDSFERVLAADNLSRREWQVLNTLAGGPASHARTVEALAPFWVDAESEFAAVVDALVRRGWVQPAGERFELTEAGRTSHAELLDRVTASRRRITEGMSAEDYSVASPAWRTTSNKRLTGLSERSSSSERFLVERLVSSLRCSSRCAFATGCRADRSR